MSIDNFPGCMHRHGMHRHDRGCCCCLTWYGAVSGFSQYQDSLTWYGAVSGFSHLVWCSIRVPIRDGVVIACCQFHILDAFAFSILKLFLSLVIVLASHVGQKHAIRNVNTSCTACTAWMRVGWSGIDQFSRCMRLNEMAAYRHSLLFNKRYQTWV